MLQILPSLRTIRLTLLIVFINGFLCTPSFAKSNLPVPDLEKKITLNFTHLSLREALDRVAGKSSIIIIYSSAIQIDGKDISLNVKNKPLKDVLNELLSPFNLNYRLIDDRIVITHITSDSIPNTNGLAISVKGKVIDTAGNPLPGASIKIQGQEHVAFTDNNGEFLVKNVNPGSTLLISYIGFKTQVILAENNITHLKIVLIGDSSQLNEVKVLSTGYETLPKERATGSFVQIDNELVNRRISTNLIDKIDGITSGLIVQTNGDIEIRGRSTLFSNGAPLIVLDNFPFNGDINNINPNDVENITVLKDAAAASAWGSRSGNGVIVITTKKGRLNSAPVINITANTTIGQKPNLYYTPQLTSSQYIDVEQFLFKNGAYDNSINTGYQALSPAVEIFLAKRNGTITTADSLAQINKLKGYDSRQQLLKYAYRPSTNQQYQASISGGDLTQKYFVSGGYDKNLSNQVNNSYDRITLNASNTYYLVNNKLEIFSNIVYTGSKSATIGIQPTINYPYAQIADANGNALVMANNLRVSYAANAGSGKMLNWLYRPLDELNNNYSSGITTQTDYRINLALNYKFLKRLQAKILYNYEKGIAESNNLNKLESYYTRNLINSFTQINATTGAVTYPLPLGGILNNRTSNNKTNDGRFQLNFDNAWKTNAVHAIGGIEIDDYTNFSNSYALYGYNTETGTNLNTAVNYTALYPNFYNNSTSRINPNNVQIGATNRFISAYFNGTYTYDDKYIASLSARKDESNLFGVAQNQKGVPLWSAGLAWTINKENFYKIDWLPQVKLRVTYGYTGNVNTSVSAYLTAVRTGLAQIYNAPQNQIVNPPNPSLRWERNQNLNIGLDFNMKGNMLSGSIEYWQKNGMDLIGNSPIAPQTGITLYTGNSANTSTKGLDIQLNAIILDGTFKWYTSLLYNYNRSLVTNYKVSNGTNLNVVSANYNNPLQGYPYYALFSFKYAGLSATGNPQGYLNGQVSTDYASILNSANRTELVYNGSATPMSFGSVRNTFKYEDFDFSINIVYKLGYYFRRSSLSNGTLYTPGGSYQMADYENRWQKPGDENSTNVPALVYPAIGNRESLYTYSNVLIEKGDHIRLQDMRLGYTFQSKKSLFKNLNVFTYINNVGILWRANKFHIDPDDIINGAIPAPRTIAFGIKAGL